MPKIRVLFLSKPYVASAYRQKLRLMAQDPRFEIGLIVPENWAGQDFEGSAEEPFWMRILPIVWNGRNHFHVYRGLSAAIREFRPDIFNIEEEHYSLVTAQCVFLARKHGAIACFYTWQNIYKNYPFPFSWLERYVFRSVAMGFAGNAEAVDILRRKGFHKPVPVLPQMGADTSALRAADPGTIAWDLPDDAFAVAFAGRLVEEKGVQDLIHAIAPLDPRIHLVILGNGPYQEHLEREARNRQVQARVHFLGSKPSTEVYRYLRKVQALALPSLTRSNWKEQFGRILVEAMLSGAVVIGSDSGEIPRVIRGAGLVFPEGNAEVLRERIRWLFDHPELQRRLAERGRKRAQRHYTNEVIAEKTLEFMRSLMPSASSPEA